MKHTIILISICLFTFSAFAGDGQGSRFNRYKDKDREGSGHQIGISAGPMWPLTDLGGAKKIGAPFIRDIDFPSTRFAVTAFYRYNINRWVSVRANLMYGMLKADDADTDGNPPGSPGGVTDSWYRRRRNLNFTTHIVEFQAMAELNLKKYLPDVAGKGEKERWAPYVGAGLGFFWFNPWTKVGGSKVKLKPLGTEGQNLGGVYGKPYKNFQFDAMALIGFKFNVTERFALAIEGVYHQTFTDYLDDVSKNYVNPDDIALLSPLAQTLQNRANDATTSPYASTSFNFVEGQYKTDGSLNTGGVGQQRGDRKDNDQFMHIQLTFTVRLGDIGGKKGAFGNCGRRNPYNHKFSCPKW
ncbi:MAG TPA: outer membrane beta-barrel protein [Chitinophagales bacterium]|nr:outer membrane beta-barrel protein [Chitinophagales bacterium]HNL83962.1 outer membrane beta-barrel protein [Chitinophagales bacterium]